MNTNTTTQTKNQAIQNQTMIKKLEAIDSIVARYFDRLEKSARDSKRELELGTGAELQAEIDKISDTERLMKIGIVGRVKAGKSSLLNAIVFDGKNILPRAATPMTAALTELQYGQSYGAEIEFFTPQDVENIKKEAQQYDRELESATKAEIAAAQEKFREKLKSKMLPQAEIESKARQKVEREMSKSPLAASKDQYTRIQSCGINTADLQAKEITFDSLEILQSQLEDYVGADGRYMPLTKSVKISLPLESLQNVEIIDTPGVNDPVISREERTRKILKECDVIFIVSPAGQFMSSEDMELMDRITQKNGIRELFVVASKVDSELHGSERDRAGGVMTKALDNLKNSLGTHLSDTLQKLKADRPEIGTAYDSLITQKQERVLHSAGIAFSIKANLGDTHDESKLDESEAHALKLLRESYPDNFSSQASLEANLDLISNIKTIESKLADVAMRKEEIAREKIESFLAQKAVNIDKYASDLIQNVGNHIKEIEETDVEQLKQQQKQIARLKDNAISDIDECFEDLRRDFINGLENALHNELAQYFSKARNATNDAEGTETETREVSTSKILLPWTWGSSRTETRTYTTVRAGAVKSSLDELVAMVENSIRDMGHKSIKSFKAELSRELIRTLRESVEKNGGSDDDININKLRSILRGIINALQFPDMAYSDKPLPSGSGTLKDYSAERFIEEAQEFIQSLQKTTRSDIKKHCKQMANKLANINIGNELFSELIAQLDQLAKDIDNKALALSELQAIKKQLQEI